MRQYQTKRQQGLTMLLTLVFMIVILGVIGLAIDTGHVLVNKTRFQNAMDAAALSAAITRHGTSNNSIAESTAAGIETFNLFKGSVGNGELTNVTLTEGNFSYSELLHPFTAGGTQFVRVQSSALRVSNFFIQIITGRGSATVGAVSTAGAIPAYCDIVPFVLCALDDDAEAEGVQVDYDCGSDNDEDGNFDCFGYNFTQEYDIHEKPTCKVGDQECIDISLETAHFQLLSVADSNSGAEIRDSIAGEYNACASVDEGELDLAPGGKVGPVSQGIDKRILNDTIHTPYDADTDNAKASLYDVEQLKPLDQHDNPSGELNKRVMVIPVGDCVGLQSGETSIASIFLDNNSSEGPALMCVLVKRPSEKPPENTIHIEVLSTCDGLGNPNPVESVAYGPFKIVLFKSENSGDS